MDVSLTEKISSTCWKLSDMKEYPRISQRMGRIHYTGSEKPPAPWHLLFAMSDFGQDLDI